MREDKTEDEHVEIYCKGDFWSGGMPQPTKFKRKKPTQRQTYFKTPSTDRVSEFLVSGERWDGDALLVCSFRHIPTPCHATYTPPPSSSANNMVVSTQCLQQLTSVPCSMTRPSSNTKKDTHVCRPNAKWQGWGQGQDRPRFTQTAPTRSHTRTDRWTDRASAFLLFSSLRCSRVVASG